ncbi:MAG: metal-dependent hydrolase [Candidatus ainarchaeum sp.]|nr:metal-dependent hydrolase [Candidatus ainarchaeum sp.]
MNKFGHIFFSIIFFLITYIIINDFYNIKGINIIYCFIITIFYALVPDLDKKNTYIRKKIDYIIFILIIILIILYFTQTIEVLKYIAILIGIETIFIISKHRGPMHSIAFGIIVALPFLLLEKYLFIFALIGFISHIIADKL